MNKRAIRIIKMPTQLTLDFYSISSLEYSLSYPAKYNKGELCGANRKTILQRDANAIYSCIEKTIGNCPTKN
jgi:hypothetical protein